MPVARVTVESIAAGGNGVTRADGLAVFVPRSAPGDVGEVRYRPRGRFGVGELTRLEQGGPGRVTPRCQHYIPDRCGGCQLQHLDYPTQLAAKRRIVRDAIVRIARRDVPLPEIASSSREWAYRTKLTLAMRRGENGWTCGLHAYDDPNRIFHLRECPITDPRVVAAWREIHAASSLLPPERELRGAVRRLDDELAFLLEGGTRWNSHRDFAHRCPSLHFIRWRADGADARVVLDRRRGATPAASFEQVNPDVATALRNAVVARAMLTNPARALDLYAGSGATARLLAEHGVEVTGVERDADAVAFASTHAAANVTMQAAHVEDVIEQLLPADVVVLNPPRAGVVERVTAALEQRPPRSVLYVSCDPATLARDVSRLPSYRISFLQAYDMFPQTAHVETLCELVPERS